jgi:hypothetical protein
MLVGTVGRCDTHWLRGLLRLLLTPSGYSEVIGSDYREGLWCVDDRTFDRLPSGQFSIDHFSMTGALADATQSGSLKTVYLYRDPVMSWFRAAIFEVSRFDIPMSGSGRSSSG